MNNTEKMDVEIVYIDDVLRSEKNAFLDDLEGTITDAKQFDNPSKGLDYIKENIDKNIIVILDWRFANCSQQGADILNSIYEMSALVPVIVFTGANIDVTAASNMFKGHAFSCLSKDASTQEITDAIEDAYLRIQNDIRSVMSRWIQNLPSDKREDPYMSYKDKSYSLNDLLNSIRRQDEIGKELTRNILGLAAEMFTNNLKK